MGVRLPMTVASVTLTVESASIRVMIAVTSKSDASWISLGRVKTCFIQ